MAVLGTALQSDIAWVTSSQNNSNFTYSAVLHCGPQLTMVPLKIASIDYLRDYEDGFADEILVEFVVIKADYDKLIFPYRDQTLITLTKNAIGTISDSVVVGQGGVSKTYRATLSRPASSVLDDGTGMSSPSDDYSQLSMQSVTYQLIDLAVEQMMLTQVGGIFRKSVPGDVLRSTLDTYSKALKLPVEDLPKGVEMVPADNTTPRNHIVLKHGGTGGSGGDDDGRLVVVAHRIQEEEGGVYNTGMACYYHNNYWYVYPPYDVTRFPKAKKTLTVLVVHSAELPAAETTFREDAGSLTIVANGKTSHLDSVDHDAINKGNGVRFAKASDLMNNFVPSSGTNSVTQSSNVMATFVTDKRDSNLNNAPFSKNRITDNTCNELSKLAMRQGQKIQLNWDRADISLVYPGMPVRVLYEATGMLYDMSGTVLNLQAQVRMNTPGMTSTRYITGVGMTLFVTVTKATKA